MQGRVCSGFVGNQNNREVASGVTGRARGRASLEAGAGAAAGGGGGAVELQFLFIFFFICLFSTAVSLRRMNEQDKFKMHGGVLFRNFVFFYLFFILFLALSPFYT